MARAALEITLSLASRTAVLRSSCQAWRSCGKIVSDCSRPQETNCWNCSDAVECTKQFFCNHCYDMKEDKPDWTRCRCPECINRFYLDLRSSKSPHRFRKKRDFNSSHTIQPPPETQNLFEYLGLPVSFEIEDSLLKKRFRELQFQLHPDKFARASDHEKEISDEHSRKLNESYKTLSEPLLRAKYLLKILGESNGTGKDLDPSSLMEMMERNERVAEMSKAEELTAEKDTVQREIDGIMAELGKCFAKKDFEGVRTNITKLSYLYSLRSSIDKRLENKLSAENA